MEWRASLLSFDLAGYITLRSISLYVPFCKGKHQNAYTT